MTAYKKTLETFMKLPVWMLRNAVANLDRGWKSMDGSQAQDDFRDGKKL